MNGEKYTSVSCFSGHTQDAEEQINISINNTSGYPKLRTFLTKNIQNPDITKLILDNVEIDLHGNYVAQLKNVYEYALLAWEQSSKQKFDYNIHGYDFTVYYNEETIKLKENKL